MTDDYTVTLERVGIELLDLQLMPSHQTAHRQTRVLQGNGFDHDIHAIDHH